jgi:cytochrome P450
LKLSAESDVLAVLTSQAYSVRSPEVRARRQRDPEGYLRIEQLPNCFDGEQHRHYRRMVAPLLNHCADVLDVDALVAKVVGDVAGRGGCDMYRDLANPLACQLIDLIMAEIPGGGVFTASERDGFASMLVGAVISTTTKAVVAILAELEDREPVSDSAAFVEDVLRAYPPVEVIPRWSLQTGEHVLLDLAAANEDATHHHSFGAGPHFCPGARLARRMLIVFVTEFQRQIPRFTLGPGIQIRWEVAA